MEKRVFVESLPKWEEGTPCAGKIKWTASVGHKVQFIYNDVIGELTITGYDAQTKKVTVQYEGNEISFFYGALLKGQIGKLFSSSIRKKGIRKIYLDSLPTYGTKGLIDWRHSIGCTVKFEYSENTGYIQIIDYNPATKRLTIKYGQETDTIYYGDFSDCKIGKILGLQTRDYKLNIHDTLIDSNRNLVIIDRKIIFRNANKADSNAIDKYYKFECKNCGYKCGPYYDRNSRKHYDEHWVLERNLLHGSGCGCCSNPVQYVVPGINDIQSTVPWMAKYFLEDDAKKYTHNSNSRIEVVCPLCGRHKYMKIQDIYDIHSIGCVCGDGAKYPEKYLFSVLQQLGIQFIWQLTSKDKPWCGRVKYDFFFLIDGEGVILEVHGKQHYEEKHRGRSLKEEQLNDKYKFELAINNGIKEKNYIVIDCRESRMEYIKDNILKSQLSERFDLSIIDWARADEFASSNLVKSVCDMKMNDPNMSLKEISLLTKISVGTISNYLVRGTKLGWCNFIPPKRPKHFPNKRITEAYRVEVFKDNTSLGIYESSVYLERNSYLLFGVQFKATGIRNTCNGQQKKHRGYVFKYVD